MQCYVRYDEIQEVTGLPADQLQALLGEPPLRSTEHAFFVPLASGWRALADLFSRADIRSNELNAGAGPLLLRIEEVAELCQISRTKLYEYVASGRIASVHVGRSRRIPRAALDTFIAALLDDSSLDGTR